MISSEALHLGPFMLPWGLLCLVLALLVSAMIGRKVGQQAQWSTEIQQRFQDSIWNSIWIGLIGARLVFIGLNLESLNAEINVYLIKFFSKLSFSKVPTHPLNSFSFPVVHVTNKGYDFPLNSSGKEILSKSPSDNIASNT